MFHWNWRKGEEEKEGEREGEGGRDRKIKREREREREGVFESFFILRMMFLGHDLIFQPVLLAYTYNNDTIISIRKTK